MVKLIHAATGGPMWVHESRVEEYLARGHKIADEATAKAVEKTKKSTKKKG